MKQKLIAILFPLLSLAILPTQASAQEEEKLPEARLQGYSTTVELPPSGAAVTWLVTLALAAGCVSVMFMSAKRSHLD